MKRIMFLVAGLVAILVGLGFVLPAVALWRTQGNLPGSSIGLLFLGTLLSLGGLAVAARVGIRRTH